ncbi:hypothetical protein [Marivita sp. GX14005]|uniref:hypothetical protein n=1 Tax=Marivita sp. GX14005 TaxID=2942276 RepID=UPI002018643E|nr:hypothetical protein [Marivita sp. GX14005]MCL3883318.1 hypothetical protein [Marivita sp. GX14005]
MAITPLTTGNTTATAQAASVSAQPTGLAAATVGTAQGAPVAGGGAFDKVKDFLSSIKDGVVATFRDMKACLDKLGQRQTVAAPSPTPARAADPARVAALQPKSLFADEIEVKIDPRSRAKAEQRINFEIKHYLGATLFPAPEQAEVGALRNNKQLAQAFDTLGGEIEAFKPLARVQVGLHAKALLTAVENPAAKMTDGELDYDKLTQSDFENLFDAAKQIVKDTFAPRYGRQLAARDGMAGVIAEPHLEQLKHAMETLRTTTGPDPEGGEGAEKRLSSDQLRQAMQDLSKDLLLNRFGPAFHQVGADYDAESAAVIRSVGMIMAMATEDVAPQSANMTSAEDAAIKAAFDSLKKTVDAQLLTFVSGL